MAHARTSIAAVNRFGLGAMPGDLERIRDGRAWLHAQLLGAPDLSAFAGLPGSLDLLRRENDYRLQRRRGSAAATPSQAIDAMPADAMPAGKAPPDAASRPAATPLQQGLRHDAAADIALRQRVAATTPAPFLERLVRFWSNHFAVSIDKASTRLLAAPMEREAIRPHVLGDFADLLLAVQRHPAMLRYLDNAASVGEASPLARRAARRLSAGMLSARTPSARTPGLNENLAREILELHTVGVDGGYGQQDVIELARALSGWGTPLPRELASGAQSAFVFRATAHEPGARTVLGRRQAEDGQAQGVAILRDLALRPLTARHLSLKLARHFVADAPPPALVERMATAYLRADGSLTALYVAMIEDDAAWAVDARKFKTPEDFVLSAMRAGGLRLDRRPRQLTAMLQQLGQPVFTPRSPAGFPDTAADWASADALRKRVQAAGALAEHLPATGTPLALATTALGESAVHGAFADLLRRAGSPREGAALLFASPAFQWRV